jgi:hypothetical protein
LRDLLQYLLEQLGGIILAALGALAAAAAVTILPTAGLLVKRMLSHA